MIRRHIIFSLLVALNLLITRAQRDPLFDEVEIHLNQLKMNSADMIFPDKYEDAYLSYYNAKEMYADGESFRDIRDELENSIYFITEINENIDQRVNFFTELIESRKNALAQNADKYSSENWQTAENLFLEAAEDLNDGDIEYASEIIPEAISNYNRAEENAAQANELLKSWLPLQNANTALANLLSPTFYNEGRELFNSALDNLAEGDESEEFVINLNDADNAFRQSIIIAEDFTNKYTMILDKREEAKEAGAENFALNYWMNAENKLVILGEDFEEGEYENVYEEKPECVNLYTTAKHKAVINRILTPAENKIETAYEIDADDLAPITLSESENLYKEGILLVESDNYTEDEVKKTADQSIAYADRAIRISKIIQESEDDNPTWEKQILSWNTIPLELPILSASPITRSFVPEVEIEEAPEPKNTFDYFDNVADIFTDDEAEIKDADGMLIISLIGLHFKPTQTNLNEDNKVLIDKAIAAINLFPGSHVTIIGHTDNASTKRFNQELSEKVAQSVYEYILNNSRIEPARISHEGHGEDEPITDNTTYESRMKNRRIDVVIDHS